MAGAASKGASASWNTLGRVSIARASRRPHFEEVAMKTLHKRCAGVDVHKTEVVVCLRLVTDGKVEREVRRFPTTTHGLLELAEWLGVGEDGRRAGVSDCSPVEPSAPKA